MWTGEEAGVGQNCFGVGCSEMVWSEVGQSRGKKTGVGMECTG